MPSFTLRRLIWTATATLALITPGVLSAQGSLAQDAQIHRDAAGNVYPSGEALIARHVEAIGGTAAIKAISSIRQSGSVEVSSLGLVGEMTAVLAAPNRMVSRSSIPGLGEIISGTDGRYAWILNPMQGPRLLEGTELAELKDAADFYGNLLLSTERYSSIVVGELAEFAGEPAFGVRLTSKRTGKVTTMHFSSATGLMIGSESSQESPAGSMQVVTVYKAYKDFSGLKFPTVTEVSVGPTRMATKIDSVSFNDVPDTAFEVPELVKPLLKK